MHSDVQDDWTIKERLVVGLDALFFVCVPRKIDEQKEKLKKFS